MRLNFAQDGSIGDPPEPDLAIACTRGQDCSVRGESEALNDIAVPGEVDDRFQVRHGPQLHRLIVLSDCQQFSIRGKSRAITLALFDDAPGLDLDYLDRAQTYD